jgi:hypothetical protein
MTTYDDDLLAARFDALAPLPLAGDWADVVARSDVARKGQPRLRRSRPIGRRRRLVVVLAAAALVVVVGTASALAVRGFVLDKGFVGLPPVGATPSAPESGELVISYRDIDGPGTGWGWVYADGRLITVDARTFTERSQSDLPEAATRWSSPLVEQRLTPEGVELLRSEVVSTGLFEHHDTLPAGSIHNVIQVRIDDRLVGVTANFPERLRERLTNPASWLPASAWANSRIEAYVPSRYEIWYRAQPQTLERSRILSLLPATAEDLLRAKDAVSEQGDIGNFGFPSHPVTDYHSTLTTEEARAVTQALDDAGLAPDDAGLGTGFEIPGTSVDPAPPEKGPVRNWVWIGLLPYLPHGEAPGLWSG